MGIRRSGIGGAAEKLILAACLLALSACGPDPRDATPALKPTPPPETPAAEVLPTPEPASSPTPDLQPTQPAITRRPLRVAYTMEGTLFVWVEGGTAAAVPGAAAPARQVAISPDGEALFYETAEFQSYAGEVDAWDSWNSTGLYSSLLDGSQQELHAGPDFFSSLVRGSDSPVTIAWMDCPQDSSSLLFTTWLNSEFGATSNLDLFEVERPGDVPEDNSPEPSSYFGNGQGGMGYSLSPDGSLIAVTGAEQITFIERSSQAVVSSHAFPPVATFSESRYAPTVTWNPGAPSAWVVVPMPPENFQVDATTTIWKVYVDGRPAEALDTFITGAPLVARTWVSPDLLWSAHIDQSQADGTHVELRLSPVGGGAGIPIARGEVEFFGWSAGSRHFLYQEDRDGDLLLGQVGDPPAAGKTSFGPGIQGAWVNEQQFLYVAKMGDAFELRLANIDGTWQSISGQSTGEISFAASPGGDTRP